LKDVDRFIEQGMRFIDHCPNCFSSTSSDEGNSDGDKVKKKSRRMNKLFMPFERYAILVFGGDSKITDREYYSKFYSTASVQACHHGAGKKYEIERKHKVKKRELLNDKLSNRRHYTTTSNDNIKGESH
jgi:hypothetical protein